MTDIDARAVEPSGVEPLDLGDGDLGSLVGELVDGLVDGNWLIELSPVTEGLAGLAEVRHAVRKALCEARVEVPEDDVVLVASELVANALRHGCRTPGSRAGVSGDDGDRVRLGVRRTRRHVTVLVSDPSPAAPVAARAGLHRVTGRGLDLVAALSTNWGWVPGRLARRPTGRIGLVTGGARDAPGKTVWATFSLTVPAT